MRSHGGAEHPILVDLKKSTGKARSTLGRGAALPPPDFFRNFGSVKHSVKRKFHPGYGSPRQTEALLCKLVKRMSEDYKFTDGTSNRPGEDDNPRIPAGYTYLAQLAGHDLVLNSAAVPSIDNAKTNLRRRAFMLDTIYGEGPMADEAAYELPKPHRPAPGEPVNREPNEILRCRLRLGDTRRAAGEHPPPRGTCTFRDLPRAASDDQSDRPMQGGRPDVLIPDPRNDDNAMLSQMTALFHLFHNAIVKTIRDDPNFANVAAPPAGADDFDDQPARRTYRVYERARRAATAAYRNVLRNDLLPRLVREEVWELYQKKNFKPLADDARDSRMPLEFSHAAARLGHAMVRQSYRFGDAFRVEGIRDAIMTSSNGRYWNLPLSENWAIQWSKFFDLGDGGTTQFSRRIRPSLNEILLLDSVISNAYIDPAAADDQHAGLALRDLKRGAAVKLQTIDAIVATLPKRAVALSTLLSDKAHRKARINAWLQAGSTAFAAKEIELLADQPPLWFYLLFEAAEESNGTSFGTLGSIIFADVFLAHLGRTRYLIDDARDFVSGETTPELLDKVFGKGRLPGSMPELVRFTAATLRMKDVTPRFI
jgi:hypothetical protein